MTVAIPAFEENPVCPKCGWEDFAFVWHGEEPEHICCKCLRCGYATSMLPRPAPVEVKQ